MNIYIEIYFRGLIYVPIMLEVILSGSDLLFLYLVQFLTCCVSCCYGAFSWNGLNDLFSVLV